MLSKRKRVDEEFQSLSRVGKQFRFLNHFERPTCLIFTESIQTRSQKFAMGGLILGLGAETPASRKPMGVGGEASWGSGGKVPSRQRHGGLRASPKRSNILHFFAKIA